MPYVYVIDIALIYVQNTMIFKHSPKCSPDIPRELSNFFSYNWVAEDLKPHLRHSVHNNLHNILIKGTTKKRPTQANE